MIELSYQAALSRQRQQSDELLFFRPEPVVTAGKNVAPAERFRVAETLSKIGIALLPTERGGQFTFHYPGQLLIFPTFNITDHRIGLRDFVRRSLEVVGAALIEIGVPSRVRLDQAGVWASNSEKKVCSIGLKIERGAVLHGLSLNVLAPDRKLAKAVYNLVDICGLSGDCISSIEEEIGGVQDFRLIEGIIKAGWAKEFEIS